MCGSWNALFWGDLDFLVFAVDSHRYAKHCILQSIFPHHLSLKVHSMQIKTFFLKSWQESTSQSLQVKVLQCLETWAWDFWLKFNLLFKVLLSWKITFPISFDCCMCCRLFPVFQGFFCANNTLECCDTWQVSTKYMQNGTVTVLIVYDSISQKCFPKTIWKNLAGKQ